MWIIIFFVLGPIIYLIVDSVIDSISDKVKSIERKKYYEEQELIYFTTYNSNLSNQDIMLVFKDQYKKNIHHYYNINYEIYNGKEDQNYAWSVKTTKETFGWGIVYNIRFQFSNGWVCLSFSRTCFSKGGQQADEYYVYGYNCGSYEIEKTLDICKEEARLIWKINGRDTKEGLPFDYIPSGRYKTSSNDGSSKKEKKSSDDDVNQSDLVSFYRNLLGLRLRFSQDELKKCYREAVGKYHPDRYGSSSVRDRENAEMLMKQVNEAYEKLKSFAL
jgi:hypothetical protein